MRAHPRLRLAVHTHGPRLPTSERPTSCSTTTLARKVAVGLALSVALGGAVAGCSRGNAVAVAASDAPATPPPAQPAPSAPAAPRFEPARLEASIDGVGVVLDAASAVLTAWSDEPMDLRLQVEATALQLGVGAQLFSSFDFSRPFVLEASFPRANDGAFEETFGSLFASIPALDPRGLVDALPEIRKPRSIGDRLWQLEQDDVPIFLREDGGALVVATDRLSLDRAAALPRQLGPGPRIRLAVTGIEPAYDEPWSRDPFLLVQQVIEQASAFRLGVDLENDHDLVATLTASAPLHALGVDLLGAPLRSPTLLGDRLPGGPALAVQLTDTSLKRAEDSLRRDLTSFTIPAPFDAELKVLANGLADLLSEAGGETVLALYVDSKQQVALVLASRLRDERRARETLRTVMGTANSLLSAYAKLVADADDYRYATSFVTNAEKLGGVAVDRLNVGIPKAFQDNPLVRGASVLFTRKKPKLEVLGAVHDGFGVIAIGPGARGVLTKILADNVTEDLEIQGALPQVRELTGGCQVCVVSDVRAMLHLRALVLAALSDDAGGRRQWEKLGKQLVGSSVRGTTLFGLRVTDREGHVALAVPREVLFAPRKDTRLMQEILRGNAAQQTLPARPTELLQLP